jgi:hypothetical protein
MPPVRILENFATGFAMSCGFFLAVIALFSGTVATMSLENQVVHAFRRWAFRP